MDERERITCHTLPEMLGAYARSDVARFHMPGHKGRGMGGFWQDALMLWDVTELSCTDNLHRPIDGILYAQRRMAEAYGAKQSWFVVNGATAAVQAMILSLSPRDKLLLSRDAHRSAVAGVALSGIETYYITPAADAETGLWGMVTPEALENALTETGATAVLLTSPNYYGFCADIPALADVAHRRGALLLVDAAHGAHFPFSDVLPTGLGGFADMWAHSQHKTMNALTQAASLHLGECRIPPETVQRVLGMIETSSPSYLLMASLDWSVYMGRRQDWSAQVRRIDALRKQIRRINGLGLLPDRIGAGVYERDRTRLVIDVTARGLTGYRAQSSLEIAGIYIEMADAERLVLITTPEDPSAWYEKLLEALEQLPYGSARGAERLAFDAAVYGIPPERRISVRAAAFADMEQVRLADAIDRTAGEAIGVYPPGIALTMPGERITKAAVEYLLRQAQGGAALFGVYDGCVAVVARER